MICVVWHFRYKMKPDFLKVRGHSDLIRDVKNNAILNNDKKSLDKYKEERDEKLKLNKVIEENNSLKKDIADIKNLLLALMEKNNK